MGLSKVKNESISYQRRRYTIAELLEMRRTLPYVCCPVKKFKPEAWSEKLLTKVVPVCYFPSPGAESDFDTGCGSGAGYGFKIPSRRLNDTCRDGPLSRQQRQEALDRLVINKKQPIRVAPPKPRVMPTIPEVSSPVTSGASTRQTAPVINGNAIRSVSLNTELSGGYGKRILPISTANGGLVTSMHAFVPGGKLKTAPLAAIDSRDGIDWVMEDVREIHKTPSAASPSYGPSFKDVPIPVPATAVAPTAAVAIPTTVKERTPVAIKVENAKHEVTTGNSTKPKARIETAINEVVSTVVKTKTKAEPPIELPKALMGKRSTSAEQLSWIQIMMSKPISASQKAPQVKEALGAVTENPQDTVQFVFKANDADIFDELHDTKTAIVSGW